MSRVGSSNRDFATCFEQGSPDQCWEWQGYVDRNGYGKGFHAHQTPRGDWAHRLSYKVFKGPIPDRFEIDHVCQNTICVNPGHLDAVSKVEHVRRTMQRLGKDVRHVSASYLRQAGLTYGEIAEVLSYRGRESAFSAVQLAIKKGLIDPSEVPAATRLDEGDREDIRSLCQWGFTYAVIGEMYGIDTSQVSRINNGMSSGHGRSAA